MSLVHKELSLKIRMCRLLDDSIQSFESDIRY